MRETVSAVGHVEGVEIFGVVEAQADGGSQDPISGLEAQNPRRCQGERSSQSGELCDA